MQPLILLTNLSRHEFENLFALRAIERHTVNNVLTTANNRLLVVYHTMGGLKPMKPKPKPRWMWMDGCMDGWTGGYGLSYVGFSRRSPELYCLNCVRNIGNLYFSPSFSRFCLQLVYDVSEIVYYLLRILVIWFSG